MNNENNKNIEEYRARLKELLNEKYINDNLTKLFLFLRERHYGYNLIHDIGDMVAHNTRRDKGLAVGRIIDLYDNISFKIDQIENNGSQTYIDNAHPNIVKAMRATRNLLGDGFILSKVDLSIKQFDSIMNKAMNKFKTKPNGNLFWSKKYISKKEIKVIEILTSYLVSDPIYDESAILMEMFDLLKKIDLIEDSDKDKFFGLGYTISLFVLANIHNADFQIPNGALIKAQAGWSNSDGDFKLVVHGTFSGPWANGVEIGVPIFVTTLDARKYLIGFDFTQENGSWDCGIAMTDEGKLRLLA